MSDSIHRRRVSTLVGIGGRSFKTKGQASRCVSFKKNRTNSDNRVLERSFSESSLNHRRDGESSNLRRPSPIRGLQTEESDQIVYLARIRSEVFASSPSLSRFSSSLSRFSSPLSPSPINQEENNKEATKVVISVAVEGSPGPIKAMVKLSCNVEEAIKIIVEKYYEEGRTPKFDQDDAFELHQSHFSIQCLDNRERIGEIGSRNFYLRKKTDVTEISPMRTSFIQSSNMIESCIAQIIGKILRRTKRIWNILVCTQ